MPPTFTHLALTCADLDASLAWYAEHTPLRPIHQRDDDPYRVAWLADPGTGPSPFVIVLIGTGVGGEAPPPSPLGPLAHLGIELDTRAEVDAVAERGRAAGCLAWEAHELPPPVGYICALSDPDGNVVEYSFGQDLAPVSPAGG
jgi:catechol 2,3-dioxygenase-like lactoylglutathione lyase family enzyme